MAKNNVLLYTDCLEQLEYLTMEERGLLFTAILNYQAGKEMPELDKMLKLIFIPIRQQIDRDNEAYVRKCEKNRENALKRTQANANDCMRTQANAYNCNLSDAMAADNDTDTHNDTHNDTQTDNDTDTHNDKEDSEYRPNPHQLPELDEAHLKMITELWNHQKVTLNIQDIKPMTSRYINTRICINGDMNQFINAISTLDGQEFFNAQARIGNTLKYDWFVRPQNYQKVVEGNYATVFKEQVPETDGYEIKW